MSPIIDGEEAIKMLGTIRYQISSLWYSFGLTFKHVFLILFEFCSGTDGVENADYKTCFKLVAGSIKDRKERERKEAEKKEQDEQEQRQMKKKHKGHQGKGQGQQGRGQLDAVIEEEQG